MSNKFTTVLAVASLLLVAATPASAAFGSATPDVTVVNYDGNPSFIVSLDDDADAVDKLNDWADSGSEREVISVNNDSRTATVAAPRGAVLLSSFEAWTGLGLDGELVTLDYVESISPNYRLARAEPVSDLTTEDEFSAPTIGITSLDDPEFATEGVAFSEDANRTTMADVRDILGVSQVDADTSTQTVAVIDTGANTADGAVFGNGTTNSTLRIDNASMNTITGESVNVSAGDYSAISDGSGHGTWTASAIGANASGTVHDGMAPDANLLVIKALADDGSGETSNIVEAIRYAADEDADVISLSLGSPIYSEALADAVEYAQEQGSIVIVAAGNSRSTRSPGIATPGDVEGVITVGASNGSGANSAYSAYFSQAGPDPSTTDGAGTESAGAGIDVVAPGMMTVARVPTESGGVENSTLSGTSMATPEVAGGIALARAANSSVAALSPEETLEAVQDSASPAKHMAVAEAGHGMFSASNLADGTQPEESQEDSQTDPAEQRNEWYQAASDASGGWLATVARSAGA